jgi:hypothetical protein
MLIFLKGKRNRPFINKNSVDFQNTRLSLYHSMRIVILHKLYPVLFCMQTLFIT